jgi:hypothetical protein
VQKVDRIDVTKSEISSILKDIRELIVSARSSAIRSINSIQVATNFEIGRRIINKEGMEELLLLHLLEVPFELRRSLRSTNAIEGLFSGVRLYEKNIRRHLIGSCLRLSKLQAGDYSLSV